LAESGRPDIEPRFTSDRTAMTNRCRSFVLVASLLAAGLAGALRAQTSDGPGIPLIVQPAVEKFSMAPAADSRAMVTGIPLHPAWHISEVNGRPALRILGAERWQFTTLDTAQGSVRWALARAVGGGGGGPGPRPPLGPGPGGHL
jgi:hypothetical protein